MVSVHGVRGVIVANKLWDDRILHGEKSHLIAVHNIFVGINIKTRK